MQNITKEHRAELVREWKSLYPTANEFIATPGNSRPASQTPSEVPIAKGHVLEEPMRYCYDFASLRVDIGTRTREITARTHPDPNFGGRGHRIIFGIAGGRYNTGELEKLERYLSNRVIPVTIGYVVGGAMGGARHLEYVAVPSLGQGSLSRDFVFA